MPVEAYWRRVDYVINGARSRGMLVIAFPAYLGFGGGANDPNDQGWDSAVNDTTSGQGLSTLQAYGTFLARRYTQGNVIWSMGGDYNPPNPAVQWTIALGIRSVTPGAIITAHGGRNTLAPSDPKYSPAYRVWSSQPGFNLNNIYCDTDGVSFDDAAVEYARPGPLPFFLIEGAYGNSETDSAVRRQVYQALLSGACGHCFGTFPIWGFGEPNANKGLGAAEALSSSLYTPATLQIGHAKALFTSVPWHLLVPRTDNSLVTSPLGAGTTRVCPALASDRRTALILTTGTAITVNLAALAPAQLRARWFNPLDGTYTAVAGSPLANTGSRSFTPPGERVLVLDAG
jgi:hypothetical protein